MRKQLGEQLSRELELDMIEYLVIAPNPKSSGKIWVAVDLLQASLAIEEMIGDLNGAKIFRKLDLNQGLGYNRKSIIGSSQQLHAESRYITTFSTHMVLMGYKQFRHLKYGLDLVECNTRDKGGHRCLNQDQRRHSAL